MFNLRGRGKTREVKCYTCGEIGHMSWECPRIKPSAQRNGNISKDSEESSEEAEVNNPPEEGESLMLNRILVKIEKKVHEPSQRKNLIRTKCKS